MAAAQGSNALVFDYRSIVVGGGDFSEFDLTLFATETVSFGGTSTFSSLVVGNGSLVAVSAHIAVGFKIRFFEI